MNKAVLVHRHLTQTVEIRSIGCLVKELDSGQNPSIVNNFYFTILFNILQPVISEQTERYLLNLKIQLVIKFLLSSRASVY